MNNTNIKAKISAVFCAVLVITITLCGCSRNNPDKAEYEKLYYEYINNTIISDIGYCESTEDVFTDIAESEVYSVVKDLKGIMSAFIKDMNNDGVPEMITVSAFGKDSAENTNFNENSIIVKIQCYTIEDNSVSDKGEAYSIGLFKNPDEVLCVYCTNEETPRLCVCSNYWAGSTTGSSYMSQTLISSTYTDNLTEENNIVRYYAHGNKGYNINGNETEPEAGDEKGASVFSGLGFDDSYFEGIWTDFPKNTELEKICRCGTEIIKNNAGIKAFASDYTELEKHIESAEEKADDSQKALLTKANELAKTDISDVFYEDYDGDGTYELFAVAGGIGLDIDNQQLIFVSPTQAKEIDKGSNYIADAYVAETRNQILFVAVITRGALFKTSYWFNIENGDACANGLSGYLEHIKGNDFRLITDAWDLFYDIDTDTLTGHTYKAYYVKWNGKAFEDCDSELITQEDLSGYKNGASVLKEIKSAGYMVDDIIKRENGIININVHMETDDYIMYENVTLKIKGNKLETEINIKDEENIVKQSSCGGTYKDRILS